jgi:CheY-like chemotaxis protein
MMNPKVMHPPTRAAVALRFVESSKSLVSSAIAMLTHPSTEVAACIAADLHTLGGEASMMNLPEVAQVAWEGESAALQFAGGKQDELVLCVRVLRRLGYLLHQCGQGGTLPSETNLKPVSRCRLLIVDDSQVSAAALAEVFEMHAYDVRVASSRQDADTCVTSFQPMVLVTDIHMPEIDVTLLCQSFRQSAVGRRVAVVLVSGRSESELRERLDAIHPDLFVPKTEGAVAVVARVSSLVQGLIE